MGISQFQLQLLQKIPREPRPPISTNDLAKALWSVKGKAGSVASLRKKIINNINHLKDVFPGSLEVDDSEKDHKYRLSSKAPFLLTSMSQEEMIAFGILSHFGTELLPDRTRETLKPYFEAAQEAAFDWARDAGFGVRASKELAGNWLKKIAVLPAVLPFVPPLIDEEIKRTVHEALFYEQLLQLKIRHMSTGEVEDCRVSPLGLVQQGVRTYLIAKKRGSRQPVSILLARIMEAAITSGHMEYPENWSLEAFLKKGIGYPVFELDKYGETFEFKFWVDAGTQWLKETKLSEKQITKNNPDGSYIIQVELPLTEELVRWLQSMTSYVRVVEPKFLVKRMKDDLKRSIEKYL